MELHTLGVEGGYGEEDVKEVAKAFTGWTVHDHTERGFYFDANNHNVDQKIILGYVLPKDRGIEDGLQVLSMLAQHLSTAKFICTKLCKKFVSDQPPQSLIEKLVSAWQETHGDIKAVLRVLFLADEFAASQGQKLRRPLDFFVAASRATGADIFEFWQLEQTLLSLGQPPFAWQPTNGYPEAAGAWMGTNGLLARWNVANQFTNAAYSDPQESYGVNTQIRERTPQVENALELVQAVSEQVFGTVLSDNALKPYVDYVSDGAGPAEIASPFMVGRKLAGLYSLMLSSPEFQWR
jgi:uncharacterized protein (DUF1800 family)